MSKWLDETGLAHLWSKIKSYIGSTTYTKAQIDLILADQEITVSEITVEQIDNIISGNVVYDDVDGTLEEITETEIDAIINA